MAEGLTDRLRQVFGDRSQSEMARRLGIAHRTVNNYVRGESPPSAELLEALHRLEDVDIGWLLTGQPTRPPEGAALDPSALSDEALIAELRRRVAEAMGAVSDVVRETEELADVLRKLRRKAD